jgi:hypothetical protein
MRITLLFAALILAHIAALGAALYGLRWILWAAVRVMGPWKLMKAPTVMNLEVFWGNEWVKPLAVEPINPLMPRTRRVTVIDRQGNAVLVRFHNRRGKLARWRETPWTNMTAKEANQKRLIAAEIIRQLWEDGHNTQLELLEMQARRSLEEKNPQHEEPPVWTKDEQPT